MALTDLTLDRQKQRALPVWLIVAVVALIIARIVSYRYPIDKGVDLVHWTPIGEATMVAKRANRPILYDFSAEWCGPCHQMEREVFMDASMADEINRRFIAVKVVDRKREDGHNDPDVQGLMERYAVNAFPTVVAADADGHVLDRSVGYVGARKFFAFLLRIR